MWTSTWPVLGIALVVPGVALASCDEKGGSGDGGSDDDDATATSSTATGSGGGSGVCSAADFEDLVVAFCEAQNPPAPSPGQIGASCADETSCDSGYCLEPYGSSAYCSLLCPSGDECPVGFGCQDTGTIDGSACYRGVCVYGGTDAADCIQNFGAELDAACAGGCDASRASAWATCLADAGRLCGSDDADALCGAERGLLESCCGNGCDANDW